MCLNNNCNDKSNTGTYIGETGRLLKFRINEHKKALLEEDISNSAMAAHFKLLHANTAVCNKTWMFLSLAAVAFNSFVTY